MRRSRKILLVLLLALVVLLLGAVYRILHSESGLQWALGQLARLPMVHIEAEGASGTLAGPLAIEHLVVDHEAVRIDARGVRLEARLRPLLFGQVELALASVDALDVVLKPREERSPEAPHFLPRYLEITAPAVRVAQASVTLTGGREIAVESLTGALTMTRWRIEVSDLVVEDSAGRVEGALTLRATEPLGLRLAANGHWRLPDERTYRFAASTRGNLDRLATTVTLAEPVDASFVGTAVSLTGDARLVGTLRTDGFDGSPWVAAGQWPRVGGSVALDLSAASFGLDGTLVSDAFGEGPMRVQGSGRWHDDTLEIGVLRAWLPRSSLALRLSGTARFVEPAPELVIDGEWTALRWPLDGQAVVESAVGIVALHGKLPYAFDIDARARAPSVPGSPDAKFTATGYVDREQLVLGRFAGDVLHGRLSGSGRVAWTGDQAWSARLEASNLDIGVLRPDLPGRMSTVATIEGSGFTAAAPWTARLASLSGSVLGRSLTGRGEVAHRDGIYELRDVRIANGASHVDVNGRVGRVMDLRWNADLRSLALLHPDLDGALLSTGHASGTPAQPRIQGDLRARDLTLAGINAGSLEAEVDVDLADSQESRLNLRAAGVDLGPVTLDALRIEGSGTSSDHGIALEISSPGDGSQRVPSFRGRLAARGGYEPKAALWRGQLDEASVTFPDGGASLLQVAAIEAGPSQWRLAPVCLQSGAARLCVEGEHQAAPEGWRLIYSAQDWPLRRVLRSLLGWKEFDGRLQAAGWIAQEQGRPWTGGMTLLLDEPTLDVPRNQFRTERVELGAGRLDVFAEPTELRATLELNLAESTSVNGELVATREPGLATLDYPVRGTIRGESSALTALPVFVPEIDRSDGRLDAMLSVAGTLGNPRFNGEFHVRDGRFDMYRTNLLLSDVTLNGRFFGDEFVFDGSGRTSRGELRLDGQFSWPDDVMTGEMHLAGERLMLADTPDYRVLASPDLTLRADARGYAVSGTVAIPLARITPRDLSTTVGTSPDERVVGAEEEDTGPSTLERVRARIRVELGDDVRVDSYGLKARLGGDVTVLSRPGDVVRGNGSIRVVEGEYKAFGQYVRIKRGVLSYNRAPIDEPTLDLVGEREIKSEDVVVAINVRGTLSEPFITLTSEPPLPDNEALSYLLTGRSINTLQSSEAATLNRAAENLAISGGGVLLGGLGTRFGLDEVTVEQTGEEDTSVVLGKYLSPRLFVSYGISIVEAINTIKLRYTLNQHWSLKAEAGLEQSGDIEYKIER